MMSDNTKFRNFDPALIRVSAGDDGELRESLQQFGWLEDLPALVDERGVTLVGPRRMRLAEELGIEPVVVTLTFGDGEEANAERIKLAIASNIGRNPLTKEDRKRFTEYLYDEHDWTIEAIAKALSVSKSTIARDLEGFPTVGKPFRPLGGRPRGSTSRIETSAPEIETSTPRIEYVSEDVTRPPTQIEVTSTEVGAVDEAALTRAVEAAMPEATKEAVRDIQKRLEQEFEERVRVTEQRLDAKTAEKLAAHAKKIEDLQDTLREKSSMEVALRDIVRIFVQTFKCKLSDVVPRVLLEAAGYDTGPAEKRSPADASPNA
jgi:ParB-like chromosome segregation protein Spo0J